MSHATPIPIRPELLSGSYFRSDDGVEMIEIAPHQHVARPAAEFFGLVSRHRAV